MASSRIFISVFSLVLLIISIYFINVTKPIPHYDSFTQQDIESNISGKQTITQKYFPNAVNPPKPAPVSKSPSQDQLYIMILDTEYKPSPYQCIMKKQWVDALGKQDFIDAIEFYSLNGYQNEECNITTITVSSPTKTLHNPSAYLLHHSLKEYLSRSNTGWLFIINDCAYINTSRFPSFFNEFTSTRPDPYKNNFLLGGCIEKRYFFKLLAFQSGIFLSRKFVENLLSEKVSENWGVAGDIGIDADEAFAHISDQLGMPINMHSSDSLVGRPFRRPENFESLKKKEFNGLLKCEIPDSLLHPFPGEGGVCVTSILRMNSLVVWAASGNTMEKRRFLEEAEEMLSNLPDNICFYWDGTLPTLCDANIK
ncbi:hypothetical protein GPJ56_005907 [Histomonas meleagridis]|uniref:uncharacterized protein n=1 Tax=Histomonas meleagridis TaxID=135588 RepID=UPI00355977BE|nr:hypothetical protein GPJ56_005907 [Histomonas meleagridis]KAH0801923.1 hypothetical protein GO595_005341 [Histomonas meleagridis]